MVGSEEPELDKPEFTCCGWAAAVGCEFVCIVGIGGGVYVDTGAVVAEEGSVAPPRKSTLLCAA